MSNRVRSALGIIVVATAAALVVYGLIRGLWLEPMAKRGGGGEEEPVTWVMVAFTTFVAGLLAWGVATLLERAGKARWWPFVGSTALAISMIGPTYQSDGESAVALIILHLVVAVVLITGFAGLILPGYRPDRTRDLGQSSPGNR